MPFSLLGFLPSRVFHHFQPNSSCISTLRVMPFMSLDTLSEFSALFVGGLLVLPSPSGLHRERLSCRVFQKEHSKEPKFLSPLIKFSCSSKINWKQLPDYLAGFPANYSSSSPRLWVPPTLWYTKATFYRFTSPATFPFQSFSLP